MVIANYENNNIIVIIFTKNMFLMIIFFQLTNSYFLKKIQTLDQMNQQ